MHKKVYFGSKPLFLTTEITEEIAPFANDKSTVVVKEFSQSAIKSMVDQMQQPEINAGIYIYESPDDLLSALKKELVLIQAGGGLVYSEKEEEILLIFRRGKWDLPKGKLDPNEQIENCALREVEEETGLQNLSLKQLLQTTYHTYHQDGNLILKESFWFLMTTPREQILTPQTEEDIEKCEWVKIPKLAPYLDNTFPAIIDVINGAVQVLNKNGKV
jgi:8-oxo-dGTP pyrophosphatase MutT (NUDIX family)